MLIEAFVQPVAALEGVLLAAGAMAKLWGWQTGPAPWHHRCGRAVWLLGDLRYPKRFSVTGGYHLSSSVTSGPAGWAPWQHSHGWAVGPTGWACSPAVWCDMAELWGPLAGPALWPGGREGAGLAPACTVVAWKQAGTATAEQSLSEGCSPWYLTAGLT